MPKKVDIYLFYPVKTGFVTFATMNLHSSIMDKEQREAKAKQEDLKRRENEFIDEQIKIGEKLHNPFALLNHLLPKWILVALALALALIILYFII